MLLHCCCAPCSSAIIEWMLAHDIRPTIYYCNPNIYPDGEYIIRRDECTRYARSLGLDVIEDDYDHAAWHAAVQGLEDEPERGRRCLECFRLRLLRTARKAAELGITTFTTTLASSRWKSLDQINEAGHWAADTVRRETGIDVRFDDRNWRKGGLQQRRNELLHQLGFYNQLYCGCEYSLQAMKLRHLREVPSTNSWMLDSLAHGAEMLDGTVVYTLRQTAGRGQMGNSWESEPDLNISFSMLLCPTFLPIRRQFVLSQLCCLSIVEALDELAARQGITPHLSVKWPNDIYAGDNKLGGILIENRLMGSTLCQCVLGVGINVQQQTWTGNAPNPVSLLQLGISATPLEVLKLVTARIDAAYQQLRADTEATTAQIQQRYLSRLYRRDGYYTYYDPERQQTFTARIDGVAPEGPIILALPDGEQRRYWFKEVRFVLPCGVTKE